MPILRSRSQGPLLATDIETLRYIIPHMERMLRFAMKLAARSIHVTVGLLDRLGYPAMLVDWRSRVFEMNAAAHELLGRGLNVTAGRLWTADVRENAALQNLIVATVRTPRASAQGPVEPIAIRRPSRRPLLVDALPAAEYLSDFYSHARALLLITDLDRRAIPNEQRLRAGFELTAAESRLAIHLARGRTVKESAELSQVSIETLRTQLKAIFAKTGTARQSELVALLSRASSPTSLE